MTNDEESARRRDEIHEQSQRTLQRAEAAEKYLAEVVSKRQPGDDPRVLIGACEGFLHVWGVSTIIAKTYPETGSRFIAATDAQGRFL